MNARTLFAAAALALVVIPAAMARELSIVSRQDPHPEAQTQAYFKPFSDATGIALEVLGWNGGIDTLRTKKDPATSGWDVVELQGDELLIGCEEGLLERLDWAQIGGKDHYLPQAVSDCGVGAAMFNFVLSWDKDKFQGTPTWADFWDVAKYPGKRGLRRSARTNLEFALLADGVAPGDVYKVLRTNDGVDRAFRKLDQLRPYIVWWDFERGRAETARLRRGADDERAQCPHHRRELDGAPESRHPMGGQSRCDLQLGRDEGQS